MPQSLKYTIVFTLFFFIIAHVGFYKKYIALFPQFSEVSMVTHFHGTLLFLWLALLVLQPFLILKRQIKLHKLIGKATYVIAPLLTVSLYLITNQGYYSKLKRMELTDAYAAMSVNIPDIVAFPVLYILAVYYRKNTAWHSRFMISTLLPIIGAALTRILTRYFQLVQETSISMVMWTTLGMCLVLILSDIKSKHYYPYMIAFIILFIEYVIWELRYQAFWQNFAAYYVQNLI